MDELLFYPESFQRRYNCNFYAVGAIPVTERQHLILGMGLFFVCSTLIALYLLCLICITISDQLKRSTYKLMLLLGVFHLGSLVTTGLFGSVFYIRGDVYCSAPLLMYIVGALDVASWCGGCLTNIFLTLNRCCVMYSMKLNETIFGPKTVYIWMFLSLFYYFASLFFVPPPLFNSLEMTYVSNPHVGYFGDPTREYAVLFGLVHNFVDFAVSIIAVTVFLTIYQYKRHSVAHNQGFDHQMFIQVLLIHVFQLFTTFGFDYIRIFGSSRPFNAFLLVAYMMSQGITPIIYLIFNNTIKNVLVTKILRMSYSQPHSISVTPKSQYVKSMVKPAIVKY